MPKGKIANTNTMMSFVIPKTLKEQIFEIASKQDCSCSSLIVSLIEQYVEQYNHKESDNKNTESTQITKTKLDKKYDKAIQEFEVKYNDPHIPKKFLEINVSDTETNKLPMFLVMKDNQGKEFIYEIHPKRKDT